MRIENDRTAGKVRRAINLVAWLNITRAPELLPLMLVLREVVTQEIVKPLGKMGHTALVLDIGTDEQWCALLAIIRSKYRKAELPLYLYNGGWKIV